ncbi:1063_t:CDS:2, partial [Cetraspora pellucida]
SESAITSSPSKHIRLSNQVLDNNEILDNYFAKPLNNNQQKKLNYLLLHATISCGFAFQAMQDLKIVQINTMSKDKCSMTLIFDGWKNGAEDISETRSCWLDVIAKTKHLLSEIEQENIQINANLAYKIEEFDNNDLHDFPNDILSNLISPTCKGQYLYDTETYLQFDDDILQFWKYVKGYISRRIRNYEEFREFENYEEFEGFKNYKEFKCNEESNHEENDNFSESRTYCNVSSEEDTDMDVDDKADNQVNSVDLWRCLVEQWLSLIEDEYDADDNSMLNKKTNLVNMNNQEELEMSNNLPIHPAVNQTAKWPLSEIFTDQLDIPNFLNIDTL